jgi:hypothetical protein
MIWTNKKAEHPPLARVSAFAGSGIVAQVESTGSPRAGDVNPK